MLVLSWHSVGGTVQLRLAAAEMGHAGHSIYGQRLPQQEEHALGSELVPVWQQAWDVGTRAQQCKHVGPSARRKDPQPLQSPCMSPAEGEAAKWMHAPSSRAVLPFCTVYMLILNGLSSRRQLGNT